MKRGVSPLMFLVLATLAITGCAQPPTDIIEAARASVAAVEAEGSQYAASALADAQAAVSRMDAEMSTQEQAFALSRDYARATELAGEAEAAATAVTAAVSAEMDRLRSEATDMIGDAEGTIAEARTEIEELDEEAAAPLLESVAGAEASVAAANDALGANDLQGAHREASAAVRAANGVTSDLEAMAAAAAAAEEAGEPTEADVQRAMNGGIDIPRTVYVNGQMLSAGAYTVRLSSQTAAPAPGLEPGSSAWLEFVSDEDGSVAGRGMAASVPDAEMDEVTTGWYPRNQAYVDELQGGEYVRVWLNRSGVTYLVHAPTSAP